MCGLRITYTLIKLKFTSHLLSTSNFSLGVKKKKEAMSLTLFCLYVIYVCVCVCVCDPTNCVVLHSMWDFSSLTRDRTCAPAMKAQSSNHWTTRERPLQSATTANLPNPLKYTLIVWEPYSNPRKGRFFLLGFEARQPGFTPTSNPSTTGFELCDLR